MEDVLRKVFILGIVTIFLIAIGGLIFSSVFNGITTNLIDSGKFSANGNSAMSFARERSPQFIDYFIIFCFVSFIIAMIILGLSSDFTPAFVIVFIVALIIAIALSGILSNVYGRMGDSTSLATEYDSFNFTELLMGHLPLWIAITGFVTLVVSYQRSKSAT